MSKTYKIHPGVGIARVGPSTAGYFLAGQEPGASPIDIGANGQEATFKGYKDATAIMRRQGARFRVFEYERNDNTGQLSAPREITSSEATIAWTVKLTCAKAAGRLMTPTLGPDGKRMIVPGASNRNNPPAGFTRDDLQATVTLTATGKNVGPAAGAEPVGKILGKDLYIGEARTDAAGRLVVLAGRGVSHTWATPPTELVDYLNNPAWHDDIADGSVDATVTFAGQPAIEAVGAWVFTAPPDFAPDTTAVATLYDIAQQAANVPLPAPLTYPQDIEPILRRAANLFFVNERPVWRTVRSDLAALNGLSDNGPASAPNRTKLRNDLLQAESDMADFRLTERQKQILDRWVAGTFQTAADPARPALDAAATLDRASLERCVGGGFFPGIEAGVVLRQPTIYSEFGRLTRGTFTDHDGSTHQMAPGVVSARMACPWQADFVECMRNWWPAQRPDITGRAANGTALPRWDRGIVVDNEEASHESRLNMVDQFARLGVIVADTAGGTATFIETGRDPALGTGV